MRLIYLTVLTASEEPLHRIVEAELSPLESYNVLEHKATVAADCSPAIIVYYREHPHLTVPFAKEITLRKKAYERYFEKSLKRVSWLEFFNLMSISIFVRFGILGMCNWMSQWYRTDGQFTHQHVSKMFANMIANGLCL